MNHAEVQSLLRLCAEVWISFSPTHKLASFSDVPHLPAHPRCAWRAVNQAVQ
ncbi:Iduronate 2-sulfatase, partial [Clarias magur]